MLKWINRLCNLLRSDYVRARSRQGWQHRFTVKENATGMPFVFAEPTGLGANFCFGLQPGTTYAEAHEIAAFLNQHVALITLL